MTADGLFEVAHELYALAPEKFTAARDLASRRARDDGDRALATEVKALRRPTQAAWAVNLLTRERADLVQQVLDLGASMREAQALLQGAELRELGRQRRQLVGAVAAEARSVATQSGHQLTESALRQVEETLQAAMADEEAAAAVRSGVLAQPLSSTGVSSLGAAVAVPASAIPARPPTGAASGPAPLTAVPDDEDMLRERRLEEARARAEDAASAARTAAEERDRARRRRAKREAKVLQHQAELEEMGRRMAELEHTRDRAADRLTEASEDLAASESTYESARRAADEAAAALRALR